MAFRGKVGFQRKHSKHRDDLISTIHEFCFSGSHGCIDGDKASMLRTRRDVEEVLQGYSNQHLEVILQNLRRGVSFERSLEGINIEG